MKAVIKAELVVDPNYALSDGFVGVDGNNVVYIGKQEPEGFDDAELVVGGEGRLLRPGFTAFEIYPVLFPFRYRIPTGKVNVNVVTSSMSRTDAFYFSLMAGYKLLREGVTTAVIDGPFIDQAGRALRSLGLRVVLVAHVGCEREEWGTYSSLRERWSSDGTSIAVKVCGQRELTESAELAASENHTLLVSREVELREINVSGRRTVALGGGSRGDIDFIKSKGLGITFVPSYEVYRFSLGELKPSISIESSPQISALHEASVAISRYLLKVDEAFNSLTSWGYEQLGVKGGVIEQGKLADLVVVNLGEYMRYPLDTKAPRETAIFSESDAETVLVGGEVVMDGGVPIGGDPGDLEKAEERMREFGRK